MQPAASIPPYSKEAVERLKGLRCSVPTKSNATKVWWVEIQEVLYIGPHSVAVKVAGHHMFGKPRWIELKNLRWNNQLSDPLLIELHKARHAA